MLTANFSPKTHRNMFLMPPSHPVVTLAQHGMLSDRHHQDVPRTNALLATLSREYQLHDQKILKITLFSVPEISQALVTCHSWSGNISSAALALDRELTGLCTNPVLSVLNSPFIKAMYKGKARVFTDAVRHQILPWVITQALHLHHSV